MDWNDYFKTEEKEEKKEVIKSINYDDQSILKSIKKLYLNDENFDLDPCFSSGNFYKGIDKPKLKYDKFPKNGDVIQNDILNGIPLPDKSVKGIVFDPPFMFGKHGKTDKNKMAKRFTMFDSWNELKHMYNTSLKEFYRILIKGGIVAFKCQDYTDSKTTLTHCHIHNWSLENKFKIEDLFILIFKGGRIWNPKLIQRHSRKYHSYWLVLKK